VLRDFLCGAWQEIFLRGVEGVGRWKNHQRVTVKVSDYFSMSAVQAIVLYEM